MTLSFNFTLMTLMVLITRPRTLAFELRTEQCVGALQIGSRFYRNELIIRTSNARILDAIYDEQNNLFFTKIRNRQQGDSYDIYVLKSGETAERRIYGIDEGFGYSTTVDRKTGDVFFATGNGLMKYYSNITHNLAIPYALYGEPVAAVFIDKLSNKYVTEGDEKGSEIVYRLKGNKKVTINILPSVWTFFVNKDNEIYYVKNNSLFVLKPNKSQATEVTSPSLNKLAQITFDADGTLYVASDALYYSNKGLNDLVSVDMNQPGDVTAIAFEKQGNFALAVDDAIFKYTQVYGCHSTKPQLK